VNLFSFFPTSPGVHPAPHATRGQAATPRLAISDLFGRKIRIEWSTPIIAMLAAVIVLALLCLLVATEPEPGKTIRLIPKSLRRESGRRTHRPGRILPLRRA